MPRPIVPKDIDDEDVCVSLEEFMKATHDPSAKVRKMALRELCPCHVKHDVKEFWDRIIEMIDDEDSEVRYQVLHNLCDGSPASREEDVIEALEKLHNDKDKYVRRRVHQVLTSYRKTGKWNIL
jgi:vesicle coat complex subunit